MPGTSCCTRLHVVDGERVGGDVGDALSPALVFRLNLVGADGLNLVQHILLAGHADGHDQNQGSGADDHAQRGQRETAPCCCRKSRRQSSDLAVYHLRRTSFRRGCGGGPHASSG